MKFFFGYSIVGFVETLPELLRGLLIFCSYFQALFQQFKRSSQTILKILTKQWTYEWAFKNCLNMEGESFFLNEKTKY